MEGKNQGKYPAFFKGFKNFLGLIFTNQMIKKEFQKVPYNFHCEMCDYYGVRESQWKRHINTKKHNDNKMIKNGNKKVRYECPCGKSYKYQSGYSRHKMGCNFVVEEKHEESVTVDMLKALMYENQKLQQEVSSMKAIIPSIANGTTMTNNTINSNNNNKIINVQMFLSEKCADAMSIQHFAKQLEVTLDDVCKSKKDCITNVVLKNLQPLSLTQRPFHCTNPKSKEWYIKDEKQGWEEDSGEKLLQNAEESIRKKWVCEFESRYPEWMENDQLREKYVEIAGSTTAQLPEKTKLKLLRELAGEVHLTKEDMV